MPTFMLLMVDDPSREFASPEAQGQELTRMGEFARAQGERVTGGGRLVGIAQAARLRTENGKLLVTDGPFAETKEMVAGFFMIEAADRAEAIEIAKSCPYVDFGQVEVRELMPRGGPPS